MVRIGGTGWRKAASVGASGAVLALALVSAAQAQDARTGIERYEAASFAANAPANAADMLARVPGFSIVDADADVRGYSGAQGNVLIDGERPSSKRENIGDLLKRIPARTVDRIELIRGGAPGIDMAGYAVIANVIRRSAATVEAGSGSGSRSGSAATVEGAYQAGVVVSTDGWAAPSGQFEYTRRSGDRTLDLALSSEPELDDDSGEGLIRKMSPDGVTTEEKDLDTRTTVRQSEASAGYRAPLAGGRLTTTAAVRGEQTRTESDFTPRDGSDPERVDEDEDFTEAELTARYARPLGPKTSLEVVASQQLGWLEGSERSVEGDSTESFSEKTDTGESIGRVDLAYEHSSKLAFSAGLEGAFNFLESQARLEEDGVAVPLPGSDVRIEERRVEGSLDAAWKPHDHWVIEAGLRIEDSTITQTGDAPLERSFLYAKPRLAATWDANADTQLRLSVSREVGQLDFGDFVASASLDTGQVTAGAADLVPDQTWRLTASWERRFWESGALTLTYTHDEISDVIDRVLVVTPDDVFDAPGNIGDGSRDSLSLDAAAPLDRIGFAGGRVRSVLLWRTSEVTDPVTGETRGISKEKPFEGSIEISQDLPAHRLHWGVTVEHIGEKKTEYRFDEIKREREAVGWTAYVERRIGERWRLRAEATDLFGRDFDEQRETWDGPRSTGALDEIETRQRRTPGFVSLTLRRSMGG